MKIDNPFGMDRGRVSGVESSPCVEEPLATAVREPPVGKKRTEPPPDDLSADEKTTTKLPRWLLRDMNTVASHKGISLYDYLVGRFGPIVADDLREVAAEISRRPRKDHP